MDSVFLPLEDCRKIAPYIPKEMLKDWEWWWSNERLKHCSVAKLHPCNSNVPALDTGILLSTVGFAEKKVDFNKLLMSDFFATGTKGPWLQRAKNEVMWLIGHGHLEASDGKH